MKDLLLYRLVKRNSWLMRLLMITPKEFCLIEQAQVGLDAETYFNVSFFWER